MQNMFNEKKAAQTAAFFLFRANGKMPVLKLMKLMYLAERASYKKFGEPIIGDKLVSMPHGPVLSFTYQHVNGEIFPTEGGWDTWVSARENYDVALQDPSSVQSERDLRYLSRMEISILEETWREFGHMTKWQIRDYTHYHCPEWKDPHGSMIPMSFEDLFKALDFNDEQSRELCERLSVSAGLCSEYSQVTNTELADEEIENFTMELVD